MIDHYKQLDTLVHASQHYNAPLTTLRAQCLKGSKAFRENFVSKPSHAVTIFGPADDLLVEKFERKFLREIMLIYYDILPVDL